MKHRNEINEKDLKAIVRAFILRVHGSDIDVKDIHIQVKSKQNWKSEWEEANFRAVYESEKDPCP